MDAHQAEKRGFEVMLLWLLILVPLGGLLLIAVSNAFFGPDLRKRYPIERYPKVSVLIPARDEEANIMQCLNSIQKQDYPNFEVLVLDDGSTDNTGTLIREFALEHPNFHYIPGEALPPGWTGKNWACHQLSTAATGQIFVFTDADNWYAPQALTHSVSWLKHYCLGMLSAFPQQTFQTLGERLVIPVVDLLVYTGLPLWLTYHATSPSLAAANGQWMVFTREAYEAIGGHAQVRGQIAEDTALARRAKQKSQRMLTMPGTEVVFGRMYESFAEIWRGFTKNLFSLMGNKTIPFFLTLVAVFGVAVVPYVLLLFPGLALIGLTGVILNVVIRLIVSVRFRHPVCLSGILHPLGVLLLLVIGLNSFIETKKNTISWKGREIVIYPQEGNM